MHLDAHRYKRNTGRGESDSGSLIPWWSRIASGFRFTYPVVVPNRAPFRQKSPGDCTRPLLNHETERESAHAHTHTVFLLYPSVSRCNLVGIQPIQPRLRLGCIAALPRLRRKGTCSPVPGGRLDQSRSCFARDRDPSFTRAPMSTGSPNKARGRCHSQRLTLW